MIHCIVSHRLFHESKSLEKISPSQQTASLEKQNPLSCSVSSFPENDSISCFLDIRTCENNGECEANCHLDIKDAATSIFGQVQEVSMSRRCTSPCVRISEVHKTRIGCISTRPIANDIQFGNILTSTIPKTLNRCQSSCDKQKNFDIKQGIGWMSMGGQIMSMGHTNSLCMWGMSLELDKTLVMKEFIPIQKVLVLAVAVAAAVKQINMKEINRLKEKVERQEHTLLLMGQELAILCDQISRHDADIAKPLMPEARGENRHIAGGIDGPWSPVCSRMELDDCKQGLNRDQLNLRECSSVLRGSFDVKHPEMRKSEYQYSSKVDSHHLSLLWEDQGRDMMDTPQFNSISSHAPDAVLFLEIKKQIELQIEKAVFDVFYAFSSVISKIQDLTLGDSSENFGESLSHVLDRKSQAVKESVRHALSMVVALQKVTRDLWHALSSEALAVVNLTAEEIENFLTALSTLSSGPGNFNGISSSLQANKLQLPKLPNQLGIGDSSSPFQAQVREQYPNILSNSSSSEPWEWQGIKTDVASIIGTAVQKTIDTLTVPVDDQITQSVGFSCNSTELMVEQLLSELEKAASKVAGMEAQMRSLEEHAKTSEVKWKEAEQKVADLVESNLKDQVKAHEDMTELTQLLRSKEATYEELLFRQKTLLAVKSKELADLGDSCTKKDDALKELMLAYRIMKDSGQQKLGLLENICRRKDNIIASLKHEQVLEQRRLQVHSMHQQTPHDNWKSTTQIDDDEQLCTFRSPGGDSYKSTSEMTPLRESKGSTESLTRIASRLEISKNPDCKIQLFSKSMPLHPGTSCSSETKPKKKDSNVQRSILSGVGVNTPIEHKKPSSEKDGPHSNPQGKSKENTGKRRWV